MRTEDWNDPAYVRTGTGSDELGPNRDRTDDVPAHLFIVFGLGLFIDYILIFNAWLPNI